MIKYYIGIDPGLNGGIVILDGNHNIIEKSIMLVLGKTKKEYDISGLYDLLYKYKNNSYVILEKQQPQFRDGKKQAFKTGFGYGILQTLLVSLKIPHQIIAAKTWQKKIFEGLDTTDTKLASIMFCKRKWPNEDWAPTLRAVKCHDGLTDAACIALYGDMINVQK
jgi:hypothetical protein